MPGIYTQFGMDVDTICTPETNLSAAKCYIYDTAGQDLLTKYRAGDCGLDFNLRMPDGTDIGHKLGGDYCGDVEAVYITGPGALFSSGRSLITNFGSSGYYYWKNGGAFYCYETVEFFPFTGWPTPWKNALPRGVDASGWAREAVFSKDALPCKVSSAYSKGMFSCTASLGMVGLFTASYDRPVYDGDGGIEGYRWRFHRAVYIKSVNVVNKGEKVATPFTITVDLSGVSVTYRENTNYNSGYYRPDTDSSWSSTKRYRTVNLSNSITIESSNEFTFKYGNNRFPLNRTTGLPEA